MLIELLKHRKDTKIETIEEAIKIAKTLAGGDFGIIVVTFDSVAERKEFKEKHKIVSQGEWRFVTKTERTEQPSSFSS